MRAINSSILEFIVPPPRTSPSLPRRQSGTNLSCARAGRDRAAMRPDETRVVGLPVALGTGLPLGTERERHKGQAADREAAGSRSFTVAARPEQSHRPCRPPAWSSPVPAAIGFGYGQRYLAGPRPEGERCARRHRRCACTGGVPGRAARSRYAGERRVRPGRTAGGQHQLGHPCRRGIGLQWPELGLAIRTGPGRECRRSLDNCLLDGQVNHVVRRPAGRSRLGPWT